MKLVYPDINKVFDTDNDKVNCIVIENQKLLFDLCMDIHSQINGYGGLAVVSVEDKPTDFDKNVELIKDFISFSINNKRLISKLNSNVEKIAISPEFYEGTMIQMSSLEKHFIDILEELQGDVVCKKMEVAFLVKAMGLQFEEDYPSLGEKVIEYMELVRHYDRDKLFIMVNLRSYISDKECDLFLDTVIRRGFHVIMLENTLHRLLENELIYIVDKELCEIS